MRPLLRVMACLPAIFWAGCIYFLSNGPLPPGTLPSFPFADKVAHAGAFGLLAWLLVLALQVGLALPRKRAWQLAFLLTVMYGAFDEVHQGWVPNREKDIADFLADSLGAVAAIFSLSLFQMLRKRNARIHPATD